MKNVSMTLLIVSCLTSNARSQACSDLSPASGAWRKIGESIVFFYGNRESLTVFRVDSQQLEQVKVRILDSPLVLKRVQVFYSSGEFRNFSIESRINPGMEAGPFVLDSGRLITSVVLRYKTVVGSTKESALTELYGGRSTTIDDQAEVYKRSPD